MGCFDLTHRARCFVRCIRWAVWFAYFAFVLACCGLVVLGIKYPQLVVGLFVGAAGGVFYAALCAVSARSDEADRLCLKIQELEKEIAQRGASEADRLARAIGCLRVQ